MNKITVIIILLFLGLAVAGYWVLSTAGVDEAVFSTEDIPADLLQHSTEPADEEVVPEPPFTPDEDDVEEE